jgi:hypothetical protein
MSTVAREETIVYVEVFGCWTNEMLRMKPMIIARDTASLNIFAWIFEDEIQNCPLFSKNQAHEGV